MSNQGTAVASGPFVNGYYLSTDATITTADRRLRGLADLDFANLGPGASHVFPGDRQVNIPTDVVPGTYFFGILLDVTNVVAELDESNNAVSVRIAIVADPG